MTRTGVAALLLAACVTSGFSDSYHNPQWMKLDRAFKVGEITGRPICVFAMVDLNARST